MQIKTFSKLVGALAYLFGKVKASEDSGYVVIVSFWLGRYWVLSETHLTKHALDGARVAPHCVHGYNGTCPECGAMQTPPRQ